MSSPLEKLEPGLLWKHFDAIRSIPRPSKHEERIAAHVEAWARDRGFDVQRDAIGNVLVRVPATPGHEHAPTVILQGHLDMVCEKNSDVARDLMTEGIDVAVDGDWVVARGTTLGADNGIGVATAMALAEDPAAVHGPLELLCTIDEETGLTGAKKLDPSMIRGRIMLNLDTEEDGAVYFGCAGGVDTSGEMKLSRHRNLIGSTPVRIAVLGLRGGHSGLNIIENRGNAIRLAVRVVLAAIAAEIEIDLVSIDGGSKHNAIPREAFVIVRIDDSQLERLRAVAASCAAAFREEFAATDPDLAVTVEPVADGNSVPRPLNVPVRDRLLRLLDAMPHGVLAMSREVPGLVETSSNLAVVVTAGSSVRVVTSQRSSVMPALYAAQRQAISAFELAGATVSSNDPYPGWKPNPESAIVRKAVAVYRDLFGSEPAVKAIHAGLECGLLIEKIPGMDAVSIGPEIRGAHSPEEKVQISSVQKFYRHTAAILADLA
jgi:dipeptidase D